MISRYAIGCIILFDFFNRNSYTELVNVANLFWFAANDPFIYCCVGLNKQSQMYST